MIILHNTESAESHCKCVTSRDAITDAAKHPKEAWIPIPWNQLRYVAGMDVVDEFPNIVVAGLAASSYQDGAPLLPPSRVEDDITQVLLPRNLCHVRNGSSRSREYNRRLANWSAYLLFHLAGGSLPFLRCGIIHLSVGPVWVQHQRWPRGEPSFLDHL